MSAKPDLTVRWSKREKALLYRYEGDKPTSMVIAWVFEEQKTPHGKSLAAELEARGYDLTTLRFQIRKKRT